jgi:hypothetical protein
MGKRSWKQNSQLISTKSIVHILFLLRIYQLKTQWNFLQFVENVKFIDQVLINIFVKIYLYCNMYEKLEFLRNLDCELRLAKQVANESCVSICHFCFVYKNLLYLKLLKWHLLRINYWYDYWYDIINIVFFRFI